MGRKSTDPMTAGGCRTLDSKEEPKTDKKNELKASVNQFGNQAIFMLEIFDKPVVVMNPKGRSNDQIPPQNS